MIQLYNEERSFFSRISIGKYYSKGYRPLSSKKSYVLKSGVSTLSSLIDGTRVEFLRVGTLLLASSVVNRANSEEKPELRALVVCR